MSRVSILAAGVPRAARALAVYGAVACFAIASFVLLHHIGNRTPFDLAVERFAVEFDAVPNGWGRRGDERLDFYNIWDYCTFAGAVLAGSKPQGRLPLKDALLPKKLVGREPEEWCHEFTVPFPTSGKWYESHGDAEWREENRDRFPYRQWWGSKALFAIALRYLSVYEYHQLIRAACYGAYALLAIALLQLGWRAFVVASPVLLFGVCLSAIKYFSDVTNGVPYVWSIVTPAVLALLLARNEAASTMRVFCFFAGMVSAYLWLLDGGNFIAVALIGLVAWLGHEGLPVRDRVGRSAACASMHVGGFAACLVGGVAVKALAVSEAVEQSITESIKRVSRIGSPEQRDTASRDPASWIDLLPIEVPDVEALAMFSALAGLASIALGAWYARRGRVDLLAGALWIAGLVAAFCVHFGLPNDVAYRAVRLMHMPLALCWSGLVFVLLGTPRPALHALAFFAVSGVLIVVFNSLRHARTNTVMQSFVPAEQIVSDKYDVYRSGSRLLYVRQHCAGYDMKRRFLLHVHPENASDLPSAEDGPTAEKADYANLDFYFLNHRLFSFGSSCQAVVDLPSYSIARITTGQYCCYEGAWQSSWEPGGKSSDG